MQEKLKPLIINDYAYTERFISPKGGSSKKPNLPFRDRQKHSQQLIDSYLHLLDTYINEHKDFSYRSDGLYLVFEGLENYELIIKSLENIPQGIRLLNVKEIDNTIKATVYIPFEKKDFFLKKFIEYQQKERNNNPKHNDLIRSIEKLALATVESFWCDIDIDIPRKEKRWCEVWLRNENNKKYNKLVTSFSSLCEELSLECNNNSELRFQERVVKLVKLNYDDIVNLILNCSFLSEIRASSTLCSEWIDLPIKEALEWSEEAKSRIEYDFNNNISVCILDTGVNNGHVLLDNVLDDSDMHTFEPSWGIHDKEGHGTLMSGVAAYGNLNELLLSSKTFKITHHLTSGKIKPLFATDEELWGNITSQVIDRVKLSKPNNKHVCCMAVTTADRETRGIPSSWSATIDSILSSTKDLRNDDTLFCISAGNVHPNDLKNYNEINRLSHVQSPAQAWNALTIGSYTNMCQFDVNGIDGLTCVAKVGELSPFSTTSASWEKQWPNKPDVVFEGGNALKDSSGFVAPHEDLSYLSTYFEPHKKLFASINQTSLSTALASNFVAKLYNEFPHLSPETIRGLIVHSSDWTLAMKKQYFERGMSKKQLASELLRIFGYGVPDFDKAVNCYKNTLTLIAEDSIQPYFKDKKSGGRIRMNEINFYELPWPKEELVKLAETEIKMRITLSYFIEPAPNDLNLKRKWNRYSYASHGLRFDLIHPNESKEQFRQRMNKKNRDPEIQYEPQGHSVSDRWIIGSEGRDKGSVISDIWEGTAADLSTSHMLCVYPIGGWWKERTNLNKFNEIANYTLIVSIYSPKEEIDIYTPVKNIIEMTVPVKVEIPIFNN